MSLALSSPAGRDATPAGGCTWPRHCDTRLSLGRRWPLTHGACLHEPQLTYRLTGDPGNPVVAVLGGISADRRVTVTRGARDGWWPSIVGDGCAIDTRRFCVLSIDYLAGAGDSTRPRQGSYAGRDFPCIDTRDQARALLHVLDHLGIERLTALVGASYGGMVGLALAAERPQRLERLLVIGAADRPHPQATALRAVQRGIIDLGERAARPREGLALARALGMVTYRSPAELARRFDRAPRWTSHGLRFAVEDYIAARGRSFAQHHCPDGYRRLSQSLDLHRVDPRMVRVPTLVIGISSDQLVPVSQCRRLARRLGGPARMVILDSDHGHDAFLKEPERLGVLLAGELEDAPAEEGQR